MCVCVCLCVCVCGCVCVRTYVCGCVDVDIDLASMLILMATFSGLTQLASFSHFLILLKILKVTKGIEFNRKAFYNCLYYMQSTIPVISTWSGGFSAGVCMYA